MPTDKSRKYGLLERAYVEEALTRGFTASASGTFKERFEAALCARFKVEYAIASNSGTSTLHQALVACDVAPGDEVITTPLAPAMCAYSILHAGAIPVFADVDPDTFLMDPADVARKVGKKTRAIMPVHIYGAVCDMPAIMQIAQDAGLSVIEDAAQCFLGRDQCGRLAGTIGDVGSFSFDNVKQLATGEGGALLTNSSLYAERMRRFGGLGFGSITAETGNVRRDRDAFQDPRYLRHATFGYNYRMAEIVAAVGLAQVERIDELISNRMRSGRVFSAVVREERCSWLVPQKVYPGAVHSYFTFACRYDERRAGATWQEFRKAFMRHGGDGIYAAWALAYREPAFSVLNEGKMFPGGPVQIPHAIGMLRKVSCPHAEALQPCMLQFTTNQLDDTEVEAQAHALRAAIRTIGRK